MSLYALLLAGGSGTRLWPLSTVELPKQFLAMKGQRTLLQETVDRLQPLIPLQSMYVVTFPEYVKLVREQLPDMPDTQIIVEPEGCGTAACVGLIATLLMARDSEAVIGSFPADLLFLEGEQYRQALRMAEVLASQGHLVALGVEPISAETGYGYIEVGEPLHPSADDSQLSAYKAKRFVSKPHRALAESYLRQGGYLWHTGVFVWRADRIVEKIRCYVPGLQRFLGSLSDKWAQGYDPDIIAQCWNEMQEDVSIEAGVVEKCDDIAVIPLKMGWSDLGSWTQIAMLYASDVCQNRVNLPTAAQHIALDTRNTFLFSHTKKAFATVGVEDLIIVETDEALLICHKDHVQQVRNIPELLDKKE